MRKYPYKPDYKDDEEWEEVLTDLAKKKVDNSEHEATQLKLSVVIKIALAAIGIPLTIITAYLLYIGSALGFYIIGGVILTYLFYEFVLNEDTVTIQGIIKDIIKSTMEGTQEDSKRK